jgi:hypothetical protein
VQRTSGAGATLNNAGILMKTAGTGTSIVGTGVALSNATGGRIDVRAGTLRVDGSFPTNNGTLNVDAGTVFATNGAALINDGTVTGKGTINVGAATLTNNKIVSPGASPGTLVISGNYTQSATGTLIAEIEGVSQGVTYDLLQVTGVANLNGTLTALLSNPLGFVPVPTDAFDVMTYASRVGDFATFNAPVGSGLQRVAGGTFYRLDFINPALTFLGSSSLINTEPKRLNDRFIDLVEIQDAEPLPKSSLQCE